VSDGHMNKQNIHIEEGRLLGCYVRVAVVRIDVSEELIASIIRGDKVFLRSLRRLLVTANVVPSSLSLVTLMKEALRSSEPSVITRAIRRNIPEGAIFHSHRRGNLKSYIALTGWTR
jgi:hypothetical protein